MAGEPHFVRNMYSYYIYTKTVIGNTGPGGARLKYVSLVKNETVSLITRFCSPPTAVAVNNAHQTSQSYERSPGLRQHAGHARESGVQSFGSDEFPEASGRSVRRFAVWP